MHDGPLKERALFLKETKEGVKEMSDKIKAVHEAGYQKGIEVGEARGEVKGEARGITKNARKVALKMIADGDSNIEITHLTDLTDQEINDLRNNGKQMI